MVKIENGSPAHAPPENTEPLLADHEEVKVMLNGATIEESTDQPETSYVVEVKNGSFSWDLDGKSNTLSQINLKIPRGQSFGAAMNFCLENTIKVANCLRSQYLECCCNLFE